MQENKEKAFSEYASLTLIPWACKTYALLKHFKGTAKHAGHIWSQQALVPSISVPSLQDWCWISLRGQWRLSYTPLSEITKLRMKLVKYARKKGCAQKSDNRERQSQTLFSITSTRLHEVSSH